MRKNLCLNCGAPLPLTIEYSEKCICEYCGQLNLLKNEAHDVTEMLDKAIHDRDNYEFSDALDSYERVIAVSPDNYQAIWGRLCCNYGVVYVEDESGNGALTCHKLVESDIAADPDYILLKDVYWIQKHPKLKKDIEKISQIQKAIRRLKSDESNDYDVFICYKQSADNGSTTDSFDAELLYYLLKKDGHRVFFAKKSLKDKAGVQYEAVIFNAIATAKVMIVLGSKEEYFTSTWVKSEWQRFQSYGRYSRTTKVIIPAYKDISVYQLPEKIRDFQAIDYGIDEKNNFNALRKRVSKLLAKRDEHHEEQRAAVELDDISRAALLRLAGKDGDIRQLGYEEEEAVEALAKSDSGYSAYLLGCIYYGQGNNMEAVRYFEKARDKGVSEADEQLLFMQENEII